MNNLAIAAIAIHPQGIKILQLLNENGNCTLWLPKKLEFDNNARYYDISLQEHLKTIWQDYSAFVFCMATGAVVRLIAPLLKDKKSDPAIVVIDATGNYVVSLTGDIKAVRIH